MCNCIISFVFFFTLVFLFYCLLFISLLLPYIMVNIDYHDRSLPEWPISKDHCGATLRGHFSVRTNDTRRAATFSLLMKLAVVAPAWVII